MTTTLKVINYRSGIGNQDFVQKREEKPKIAIIGSRGIPPRYGGAETFVYELTRRLRDIFDLYVTCETNKFYIDEFEGIKRVHIWAHHTPTITIPSIYDIVATLYLLTKIKDIKLITYVTPDGALAGILARLAKRKVVINTDGIEWQRLMRRIKFVPWYLKPLYALTSVYMLVMEFLACKVPHVTIADSISIKRYLESRWRPHRTEYIAYGIRELPHVNKSRQKQILEEFKLEQEGYYLTIGRIVAENNIHMEVDAFKKSKTTRKLVIVGPIDLRDPYVRYLFKLRGDDKRIIFTGPVYDPEKIYTLRTNCRAYIHAYTVGGTNPSLLEQLQFDRPIIAYDVPFHREILGESGLYFKTTEELARIIDKLEREKSPIAKYYIREKEYIKNRFSWNYIAIKYSQVFLYLIRNTLRRR